MNIKNDKEKGWENISHEIRAVTTHHMSTIGIEIYHGSKKIGFIDPNGGMNIVCSGYMADWVTPNRWEVYKKKQEKDNEDDYMYVGVVTLKKLIKEEVEKFMKKWVHEHIYDIK